MNGWFGLAPSGLLAVLLGTALSVEVLLRLPLSEHLSAAAADVRRVIIVLRASSASDSSKQRAARIASYRSMVAGGKILVAVSAIVAPLGVGAMIAAGDAARLVELSRSVPLLLGITAMASGYAVLRKLLRG